MPDNDETTAETEVAPAAEEPFAGPAPAPGGGASSHRTVTMQLRWLVASAAAAGVLVFGLLAAMIVSAADDHEHGPPDFHTEAAAAYGSMPPPMEGGPQGLSQVQPPDSAQAPQGAMPQAPWSHDGSQ